MKIPSDFYEHEQGPFTIYENKLSCHLIIF